MSVIALSFIQQWRITMRTKLLITGAAALFLAASSLAFAAEGGMDGQPRGTDHTGYGRDNPRGKSGGYEYGKNPTYNGSRMCNRCDDIDYNHPQSVAVTRNSSSSSLNVGMTGPAPSGSIGINSSSTSTTTTYGRATTGVNADGGRCSCGGGWSNRR